MLSWSNLFLSLSGTPYASLAEAQAAGAPTLNYGVFLNTVIDFIIVAFVIFLLVRAANKMRRPAPAAAPTTGECPYCLSAIPLKATRCPQCTSEVKAV